MGFATTEPAMHFHISGLPAVDFKDLFALDDASLDARGMCRMIADADFGYPDRVTLSDVPTGTELILLNFHHQTADTAYNATGPIFVSRGEGGPVQLVDQVPDCLRRRQLSLRGYDQVGMMTQAVLADGADFETAIETLFDVPGTSYVHAHYATRGCFAARIDRHQA
jgi:hypothetical protein